MEVFASALELEASRFKFDPIAYQYTSRGQPVSWQRIRLASDQYGLRIEREVLSLTAALMREEITLAAWQREVMALLKSLHLNNIALSRGGYHHMSPADYGRAGGILAREYRYLQRFATQIARGLRRDGNLIRRMQLYARAGRSTYLRGLQDVFRQRGFDEERSVLTPAEHCTECVEQQNLGFQQIGDMIPVGDRQCLRQCKCQVFYRRSADGEVTGPF